MAGRTRCIILPNKRDVTKDAGKVQGSPDSVPQQHRAHRRRFLQLVAVPSSLDEFLKLASEKLNVSAKRAFTENGVIVDDVSLIRDDERIFISSGEAFWKYDGTFSSMHSMYQDSGDAYRTNCTHRCKGQNIQSRYVLRNPNTVVHFAPTLRYWVLFAESRSCSWSGRCGQVLSLIALRQELFCRRLRSHN